MNNVLELKGNRFIQAPRTGSPSGPAMNGKKIVTSYHLKKLQEQIEQIKKFWQNEKKIFDGVFITIKLLQKAIA